MVDKPEIICQLTDIELGPSFQLDAPYVREPGLDNATLVLYRY